MIVDSTAYRLVDSAALHPPYVYWIDGAGKIPRRVDGEKRNPPVRIVVDSGAKGACIPTRSSRSAAEKTLGMTAAQISRLEANEDIFSLDRLVDVAVRVGLSVRISATRPYGQK